MSLARHGVVIDQSWAFLPLSLDKESDIMKICETILQKACNTFHLPLVLTQIDVVLTITQNDSLFIFRFAGSFDDKMQMHACL